MLTLSQPAKDQLDAYFADKEKTPIRIFLTSGGCSGPQLALALDDPKDTDDVLEEGGYRFLVDKELLEQAKPLGVDFTDRGLSISSNLQLGGGGCSCCSHASPSCSS